jgi:hypothetical protein
MAKVIHGPGRVRRIAAGALVAVAAIAACGDEPTLSAQKFVQEVNRQGVELRLGEPLVTDDQGKELYAVELEPLTGPRVDSHGDPIHSGGSLSVYDDSDGANGEYANCRRATDLLCYRLDNIVVVLEGGGLETRQLGLAMQRLAD